MPTQAPAETDVLCENCGYILNGLPETGNCPECGSPIDLSVAQRLRRPPIWEAADSGHRSVVRFLITTAQIIFRPTRFFRSTTSRGDPAPAQRFARIHWRITALMLGTAAWLHWNIFLRFNAPSARPSDWMNLFLLLILVPATYAVTVLTVRLATQLTAWEAAYRGYRLPQPVVLRALNYHAAHSLPVATLALATVGGYIYLQSHQIVGYAALPIYLYVLCGEVVLAAVYLFATYWIAMRNLMYANR